MVRYCSVDGCLENTKTNKNRRFYRFPGDERRCRYWLKAVGRMDLESKGVNILHTSYFVCELHFTDSDCPKKYLRRDAVPTLFLRQLEDTAGTSRYTQTDFDMSYCSCNLQESAEIPNTSSCTCDIAEDRCDKYYKANGSLVCTRHFCEEDVYLTTEGFTRIKSPLPQLQVNCASAPNQSLKIPEGAVIIARVYKYLQKEYEELKARSGDAPALSSLGDILGRTAAATGLSQRAISAVLEAGKRSHAGPEGREQKRAKYYFDENGSTIDDVRSCVNRDNTSQQDTCKTSSTDHNVFNSSHNNLRTVPDDGKNLQLDTNSSAHHVTDASRVVKIELPDNQSERRVIGPCSRHEIPDSSHVEVKVEPPDENPQNGQQDEDGYELRLKFEADEEHAIRTAHHLTPDRPHVEVKIEPPDGGIHERPSDIVSDKATHATNRETH